MFLPREWAYIRQEKQKLIVWSSLITLNANMLLKKASKYQSLEHAVLSKFKRPDIKNLIGIYGCMCIHKNKTCLKIISISYLYPYE